MPSGYKVGPSNSDLDTFFNLYSSGTKAGATGFKVGSQDLADRYQLSNNEGYDRTSTPTRFKAKWTASWAAGGDAADLKNAFQLYGY